MINAEKKREHAKSANLHQGGSRWIILIHLVSNIQGGISCSKIYINPKIVMKFRLVFFQRNEPIDGKMPSSNAEESFEKFLDPDKDDFQNLMGTSSSPKMRL